MKHFELKIAFTLHKCIDILAANASTALNLPEPSYIHFQNIFNYDFKTGQFFIQITWSVHEQNWQGLIEFMMPLVKLNNSFDLIRIS